jgi:hypothetical protein
MNKSPASTPLEDSFQIISTKSRNRKVRGTHRPFVMVHIKFVRMNAYAGCISHEELPNLIGLGGRGNNQFPLP